MSQKFSNMNDGIANKVGQASSLSASASARAFPASLREADRQDACPTLTGRRYWRSLDELADQPEFKDWLHREFPVGASELVQEGTSRRNFLKIMSASFAFAGLAMAGAGCRRPEEKLEPFGKQPENYTFGDAQYFATAMPLSLIHIYCPLSLIPVRAAVVWMLQWSLNWARPSARR